MNDKEIARLGRPTSTVSQEVAELRLELGAWTHKVRQLTTERDNLLDLNRILEADRKALIEEVDTLQQVARQSYGDLQREYMALEVKYHDLKEQHDITLARAASYEGALLMVTDQKPMKEVKYHDLQKPVPVVDLPAVDAFLDDPSTGTRRTRPTRSPDAAA